MSYQLSEINARVKADPKGFMEACDADYARRISEAADRVTASVRDTGPGIPVAERGKVLRRLYRLEKSRSTEGTGLGLALVKAVAELHTADLVLADAEPGLRVELVFLCCVISQ